jgi:hypothetical protein
LQLDLNDQDVIDCELAYSSSEHCEYRAWSTEEHHDGEGLSNLVNTEPGALRNIMMAKVLATFANEPGALAHNTEPGALLAKVAKDATYIYQHPLGHDQFQLISEFLASPQDLASLESTCRTAESSSAAGWENCLRIVEGTWSCGYNLTPESVDGVQAELHNFKIHSKFVDPRVAMATSSNPNWRAPEHWNGRTPSAKTCTRLLVVHIRRCRDRARELSDHQKDELLEMTVDVMGYRLSGSLSPPMIRCAIDRAVVAAAHVDIWDRCLAQGGVLGPCPYPIDNPEISFLFSSGLGGRGPSAAGLAEFLEQCSQMNRLAEMTWNPALVQARGLLKSLSQSLGFLAPGFCMDWFCGTTTEAMSARCVEATCVLRTEPHLVSFVESYLPMVPEYPHVFSAQPAQQPLTGWPFAANDPGAPSQDQIKAFWGEMATACNEE